VCVTDGFPLVGVPGGNVFFTNSDLSTPPRPDGSQAISCRQIPIETALYDVVKVGRWLARLAELAFE